MAGIRVKTLRIAAVPHGACGSSVQDWAGRGDGSTLQGGGGGAGTQGQQPDRREPIMGAQDLFERRRRLMEDWEANLAGAGRDQEARPIR